jgi:hypothetical protein
VPLRIFLGLMVLVWLPYGLFCLFQPGYVGEATGMAFHSTTANTEIRAMYGGLQAAIGLYALVALLRSEFVRPLLVTLLLLCSGLALGRLVGLGLDGGATSYTIGALGFEIAASLAALYFLSRTAPQPAT